MHALTRAGAVALTAALVSSCQSEEKPARSTAALPVMERVALGARDCWFKSKDPAFAAYRLAPELNSFSGRPRILLVKSAAPTALPSLVVQAEGNPAKLEAFGPLMQDTLSARITADVNHWARGGAGCRA
ncbi:hypothetical protein [Rhizobium sp. L1K21]|uniref:hypothetical protein n=1 Tax=Rhizobium sp. L1K21 TaxID=2954933 RepID=UPI00209367BA|nr:hypothetical protein [Rhizobium sp. L1K21]MCO6186273.1 hypothetical protein [Rhizobium sp. L1K21]